MKRIILSLVLLVISVAFGGERIETVGMVSHARSFGTDARWPQIAKEAGLTTLATHIHCSDATALLKDPKGQTFVAACDRLGVTLEHEVHAFGELLPRTLFEMRPELFPLKNGRRDRGDNCCFTNPEAQEIMASNAVAFARQWAHGEKTSHRYFFWPDDLTGPCECGTCKGYNAAEQALLVENAILRRLREFDPKAMVSHLAYGKWAAKPEKVKSAEGVFLEYAPIDRDRSRDMDEKTRAELKGLLTVFPAKTAQVLEYWLDFGLFSGWTAPVCRLPWNIERLRADIDAYARMGIRHFTTFGLTTEYLKTWGETHARQVLSEYAQAFRDWPYKKAPNPNARLDMQGFVSFAEEADGTETMHIMHGGQVLDFCEARCECLSWQPKGCSAVRFLPAENGFASSFAWKNALGFAPVVRRDFVSMCFDSRSNARSRTLWNVPFVLCRSVKMSADGLRFSYAVRLEGSKDEAMPARLIPDVRIRKPAQVEVSDLHGWTVTETETEIRITQDAVPLIRPGRANSCDTWFCLRPKRSGRPLLSMTVLNTDCMSGGVGQCCVFRTASGKTYLYDTGNGEPHRPELKKNNGKDIVIPWLKRHGIEKMDGLIISHYHADHFGGFLYMLDHFPIERVYDNSFVPDGADDMDQWTKDELRFAKDALAKWEKAHPGRLVTHTREGTPLGWDEPGIRFEVVWPPKDAYVSYIPRKDNVDAKYHDYLNSNATGLKVYAGEVCYFVMGDINARFVTQCMRPYMEKKDAWTCDVVVLPAHGTGNKAEDVLAMRPLPQVAVAAQGNIPWVIKAGRECLADYVDGGIRRTFVTNIHGDVTVETDGKILTVLTDPNALMEYDPK